MTTRSFKELDDVTMIYETRGGMSMCSGTVKQIVEIIKQHSHEKVMVLFDRQVLVENGYNMLRMILKGSLLPYTGFPRFHSVLVHSSEPDNKDTEIKFALFNPDRPDGLPYGYGSDWHTIRG